MTADGTLTEIVPGIHGLRLPLPFPVEDHVNTFLLVDGAEIDMIDCGLNSPESIALVRGAITALAGPGATVRRLIVTHIHPDHFGAAGLLGARELYLHRLEVPLISPRYLQLETLVSQVGTWLRLNGVPPAEADLIREASRGLRDLVTPGDAAVVLDGAETIELGGREMRVHWTPGHSPGHICLFDVRDGLLFSGDQMLPDISSNIGLHPQSTPNPVDEYLDSLDRLESLGAAMVLPAHGQPFSDASGVAEQLRSHHDRRKHRILELIGSATMTGWEVALGLWGPRQEVYDRRLALQEGLAHLQSLAVDGRLRKLVSPTTITWGRAG